MGSRVFSSVAASFQKSKGGLSFEEGATVTLAGLCGELGIFFFPFLRLENLKKSQVEGGEKLTRLLSGWKVPVM